MRTGGAHHSVSDASPEPRTLCRAAGAPQCESAVAVCGSPGVRPENDTRCHLVLELQDFTPKNKWTPYTAVYATNTIDAVNLAPRPRCHKVCDTVTQHTDTR